MFTVLQITACKPNVVDPPNPGGSESFDYDRIYAEKRSEPFQLNQPDQTHKASHGYSFKQEQGYNGWYYKYSSGTTFSEMELDSANKKWIHAEASIENAILSPSFNTSVAREFVSNHTGLAYIYGNYRLLEGSNGANVKVYVNNQLIHQGELVKNDQIGFFFEEKYNLKSNDKVRFLVTGDHPKVYFNPTVSFEHDSNTTLYPIFTVSIGTLLGMISGFVGGTVDKIIQWITNIVLTIPSFPIMMVLASIVTITDAFTFAICLSAWSWAGLCRSVRSQIMSLKERDFIQICKVMNMSKTHIIFKELFPNITSYVIINFIMSAKNAILGSVGIMMLGLAAYEPTNWGAMIEHARSIGLVNPNVYKILLPPLVSIVVFQFGAIYFANGLDEIFNPRLRVN